MHALSHKIYRGNTNFYRLDIPVLPLCDLEEEEREKEKTAAKKSIKEVGEIEIYEVKHPIPSIRHKPHHVIRDMFQHVSNGIFQHVRKKYLENFTHFRHFGHVSNGESKKHLLELAKKSKAFMGQKMKELAKLGIRFAAAASAIFIVGFFLLNYQAYFQITKHYYTNEIKPMAINVLTSVIVKNDVNEPDLKAQQKKQLLELVDSEKTKNTKQEYASFSGIFDDITPPDNRIIIPKIGKNIPIVETEKGALYASDWNTFSKAILEDLKRGVVRYPGSARPGQKGNVFITGHSSYYPWDDGKFKDVFALLPHLEIGDEIIIYFNQKKYRYKIAEKKEVKPQNTEILKPTDDFRLTLMTCTPVGTNLRRLVITAFQQDEAEI